MTRKQARVARRWRTELLSDDPLLIGGLGAAYAAFAITFRGSRGAFWGRMTRTGLGLGTLTLAAEPSLRRLRPSRRPAVTGAASAAALYGIFRAGDVMARRIMPAGADQITDIYALRSLEPAGTIAARLALVIGPAEELFWRGFVQARLRRRYGDLTGTVLASVAYGGAHLATGNATLVGAATVAGAYWGALSTAGASMESLIASHVLWDILTFLVAPTTPVPPPV